MDVSDANANLNFNATKPTNSNLNNSGNDSSSIDDDDDDDEKLNHDSHHFQFEIPVANKSYDFSPELVSIVGKEYATKYLEKIGACPTQANIKFVVKNITIHPEDMTYSQSGLWGDVIQVQPKSFVSRNSPAEKWKKATAAAQKMSHSNTQSTKSVLFANSNNDGNDTDGDNAVNDNNKEINPEKKRELQKEDIISSSLFDNNHIINNTNQLLLAKINKKTIPKKLPSGEDEWKFAVSPLSQVKRKYLFPLNKKTLTSLYHDFNIKLNRNEETSHLRVDQYQKKKNKGKNNNNNGGNQNNEDSFNINNVIVGTKYKQPHKSTMFENGMSELKECTFMIDYTIVQAIARQFLAIFPLKFVSENVKADDSTKEMIDINLLETTLLSPEIITVIGSIANYVYWRFLLPDKVSEDLVFLFDEESNPISVDLLLRKHYQENSLVAETEYIVRNIFPPLQSSTTVTTTITTATTTKMPSSPSPTRQRNKSAKYLKAYSPVTFSAAFTGSSANLNQSNNNNNNNNNNIINNHLPSLTTNLNSTDHHRDHHDSNENCIDQNGGKFNEQVITIPFNYRELVLREYFVAMLEAFIEMESALKAAKYQSLFFRTVKFILIRVGVETVIRLFFEEWSQTAKGIKIIEKIDSFIVSLFDPEQLRCRLASMLTCFASDHTHGNNIHTGRSSFTSNSNNNSSNNNNNSHGNNNNSNANSKKFIFKAYKTKKQKTYKYVHTDSLIGSGYESRNDKDNNQVDSDVEIKEEEDDDDHHDGNDENNETNYSRDEEIEQYKAIFRDQLQELYLLSLMNMSTNVASFSRQNTEKILKEKTNFIHIKRFISKLNPPQSATIKFATAIINSNHSNNNDNQDRKNSTNSMIEDKMKSDKHVTIATEGIAVVNKKSSYNNSTNRRQSISDGTTAKSRISSATTIMVPEVIVKRIIDALASALFRNNIK